MAEDERQEHKSIMNANYGIIVEIRQHQKKIAELRKYIIPPCKFCSKDGFACEGCKESDYSMFVLLPKESK